MQQKIFLIYYIQPSTECRLCRLDICSYRDCDRGLRSRIESSLIDNKYDLCSNCGYTIEKLIDEKKLNRK